MNQIQIFKNEAFGEIRVTEVNGDPMFCLADIAKSLGYARPADAVAQHCKGVAILPTPTSNQYGSTVIQDIKFGKESEVYRLVMKSKLPEAEKFQDWVCEEVLPSIRKHGAYMTDQTIEQALDDPDTIIKIATKLKEERQQRQLAESKARLLEEVTREQAPKVLFANAVETSKQSCLIGELAKILKQNGIEIGQNRLFDWLRSNGYLCSKGELYNQPTQKAMDLGLFEVKKQTIAKPDGCVLVSTTTKCTGKGQIYFVSKFMSA